MKKRWRWWVCGIGGYLMISLPLGYAFQGFYFMTLGLPAGIVYEYAAKQVGYDFVCYDLHGDWKCKLTKTPPTDAEIQKYREDAFDPFTCHEDSDCLVTKKGGCALKKLFPLRMFQSPPDSNVHCVCLTGPVIFGCMTEKQAAAMTKQQ